LRVLILEDKPADAELIERELRRAGIVFTSRLVEGKRKYSKALADFQPQVILADFKLPLFDGLAALKITRLRAPDTPFIFVSGSIGEEKAIELLAQGASDYILKDTLQRLGPAVKRVIEETRLKLEKKKSDEELQRYIDELQLLSEAADRFVHINDLDELYDYLAQTIRDLSGADYLLLSLYDKKLQAVRPKIVTGFEPFQETIHRRFHIDLMEMVFYLKDMRQDDFSDFVSRRLIPVRDGLYGLANRKIPRSTCRLIEKLLAVGSMHTMGFSWENQLFGGLTVFFKKANELKNASQIEALANLAAVSIKRLLVEQVLRESEKKYRTLVTQSPDGIFVIDLQGNFLSVNQAMCAGLKYSEEEFLSLKIWDIVPEQYLDLHKKRLAAILKGKEINEAAEYMVRGKDGETHYVAILSTPFYKDNTLIGFQGIARDISESKKMEIRLRESEEYYRTLVETSPDAIIIVDAGACVTFASSKAHEIFGIPAQIPIIGVSLLDFVDPGEIPRVQERMVEILSGRSLPQINEYRLLKQDHQLFWGEVSSAPLRDAAGRSIGLLIVCRDISSRKRAETIQQIQYKIANAVVTAKTFFSFFETVRKELSALLDTTNFLVALYDEARGMLSAPFEKDEKDAIQQWPAEKSLTGLVIKQKRSMLLHGEQIQQLDEAGSTEQIGSNAEAWLGVPLLINEKVLGAIVVQSYDNADAYDQNSIKIMEMIASQLSVYIERKRAESQREAALEELRISAEKWQTTFDSITDIVSVISPDHMFLEINKAGCDAMGLKREDIIGKKCYELVHHLHNPLTGCPCSLTIQSKKMEVNEVLENGRYYQLTAWPILDANGELLAFSHTVKDISDRKRAEEQIQYQASLLQNVSDAIIATDKNSNIQAWNKAAEKIYDWKAEETIGKKLHDVITPEYHYQSREEVIEKLEKEGAWSGEIIHHRRDGNPLIVQSSIKILKDAAGDKAGMVSVNHDISERKRAEEQIRASLKEKEVLLQEIHHRVKNNLQIISGLLTLQADQSAGKSLAEIFRASQDRIHSIALIHEKLYQSRNLAEIAFDEYLRALVENLFISHGVAAGRITARYEMESILFTIEKAIPLGLIVNELITNALKHAFPAGQQGEIRIGLHGYKGAKSYALKTDSGTLHCVPTCELIVADNGVGLQNDQIPEQQKSLGMNLVSMLAKQIQAELKVTTGPGTEFRLLFPGLPANEAFKDKEHGG